MTRGAAPRIPVSWGELLDKIAILAIKRERIADPAARADVAREHALLWVEGGPAIAADPALARLFARLGAVNAALWEIEDAIRAEDARGAFGAEFVALARAVYMRNDERAAIKREINALLGSALTEQKSYWSGTAQPAAPDGAVPAADPTIRLPAAEQS